MIQRKLIQKIALCAVIQTWCFTAIAYDDKGVDSKCTKKQQFTFSWPFGPCANTPRGGTTQGPPVTLVAEPSAAWESLGETDLSKKEKDRRAILAMAGVYRTSFDFIETVGYVPDFKPDRPYQSWGTEWIFPIVSETDDISLQHIMVMYFQQEDDVLGPFVVKHWRQDWTYEKRRLMVYAGHSQWHQQKLKKKQVKGKWAQTVFQVDDSPRYESVGHWEHYPNFSTWISDTTWRPLPRREFSVRDDYHVLEGTNRHTIVPNGWVHEEENYKVVLTPDRRISEKRPYLAKEIGVNRYEPIVDFDYSAGKEYWETTKLFWQDVRAQWRVLLDSNNTVTLAKKVDDKKLYEIFFDFASTLEEKPYHSEKSKAFIKKTLERFVTVSK